MEVKKWFAAVLLSLIVTNLGFGFDDPTNILKKNNFSANFVYHEKGFGVQVTTFKKLTKDMDLTVGLLFSSVRDTREFEQKDIFGNSIIPNKENRVFMIPLSIGVQKKVFNNLIAGKLTPIVSAGIAPTLVMYSPYSKSFFESLSYYQAGFAVGPYVGLGMEFTEFKNFALSFNAKYYYLPVIGRDIYSLKDSQIKNVGGLNLTFGINFLK